MPSFADWLFGYATYFSINQATPATEANNEDFELSSDAEEAKNPAVPGRKWAECLEKIQNGTLQATLPNQRTNRRIEAQKEILHQKEILADPSFHQNPTSAFNFISQQLEAKIAAQQNN